jgi:hypothetical protein
MVKVKVKVRMRVKVRVRAGVRVRVRVRVSTVHHHIPGNTSFGMFPRRLKIKVKVKG